MAVPLIAEKCASWGLLERPEHWVATPQFRDETAEALQALVAKGGTVLPQGLARSYGDSCLNAGGGLLRTPRMARCHFFDQTNGILRADAGLSLAELHKITVPQGWFVAVTPGTKFVTLGGAVANDVHGKNHHLIGSFGHHVRALGLRRSDGTLLECGPHSETDLFRATIGGLGLTGLVEWVEIALQPITSSDVEVETIRFGHVNEFFALSADSAAWPYTVSWIDCHGRDANLGRGLFARGRHATTGPLVAQRKGLRLSVPLTPPVSLVNSLTVPAFNAAYYNRPGATFCGRSHFDPFFYPLDGLLHWNRMYGPRGFYQYQCALPHEGAQAAVISLLERIAASGAGSFLVVLKVFGDAAPAGLLSFPRPGVTLALDFPNLGAETLRLMTSLDEVVMAAGGRLYPAKDARMSAALFQASYPVAQFTPFIDPVFASGFWRRVGNK